SETVTVGATTSPVAFGYDNDDILICASPSTCSPAGSDALKITLNAGNGLVTGSTHGLVTDTLTYNAFGELASYAGKVGATGVFSEVVDTASNPRDALGRIVQRVETNGGAAITWRYTYDLRGRLSDVLKDGSAYEQYGYDGNGNRTLLTTPSGTTAGVYDAQERLLSYGSTTYTYTANGELRTKTDAGGTTTYTYDVRSNLVRVDLPSGDVIQYLVDGQDRRVAKKKNGVLERAWLYRNQLSPVAELDGLGNLVSRFVYGARSNVPEYVVRGGVTYRVLSDHLGSPRVLVDVATGVVAWRADFDAWGNRSLIAGPADFFPFGFAGGMLEPETGLTRFGARDYDPTVGRWVSKDPIRFSSGDVNLFVYSRGEPINKSDRTGTVVYKCGYWSPGFKSIWHEYNCVSWPDGAMHCFGFGGTAALEKFDPNNCEALTNDGDYCMDLCVTEAWKQPKGKYDPFSNNCWDAVSDIWSCCDGICNYGESDPKSSQDLSFSWP
ncbi:MAG: hypothetical protein HYZ29_17385, partial [Myxococcales bacterium]|nr:hypothetical protein [Myxococcales bacterium]